MHAVIGRVNTSTERQRHTEQGNGRRSKCIACTLRVLKKKHECKYREKRQNWISDDVSSVKTLSLAVGARVAITYLLFCTGTASLTPLLDESCPSLRKTCHKNASWWPHLWVQDTCPPLVTFLEFLRSRIEGAHTMCLSGPRPGCSGPEKSGGRSVGRSQKKLSKRVARTVRSR